MKLFGILSTLAAFLTWAAQAGQTVQYFPHFAFGSSAESDFIVHNPADQPLSVSLELFLSDGSALASRQVEVPAQGTVTEIFADPSGELTTGWARLSSDQEFDCTLFARISGVANVGVGPSPRATRLRAFNFAEKGARTGFAVVNPSATVQSELTFRGLGVDGSEIVRGGFTLAPGEHRAFFLDEAPTSAGRDGTIELEAGSAVIAVAIRLQNSLASGVPVAVPGLIRVEFNDVSPNVIGGHDGNQAAAGVVGAAIGGGGVDGTASMLSGDFAFSCPNCVNRVSDNYGTVGGGLNNEAAAIGTTVGGGRGNTANGIYATLGGGDDNNASGQVATVGGGLGNATNSAYATVSGGSANTAAEQGATVSGGQSNDASAIFATVGGGFGNDAAGESATVSGGASNDASGDWATVGGGIGNTASGNRATVSGGQDNTASGNGATVPGGLLNSAGGSYSFAAGRRAKANFGGSMVFADSGDADFEANRSNSFNVRASGGVFFYSNEALSSGVRLARGSSSWSMVSDRANKENVAEVDSQELLQSLAALPIGTWNYKSQDERIRHMGPMAQDFHAAFGLGEDERRISSVDADGVALAAIQGLYRLLQEKEAELESLRSELKTQRSELAEIRAMIDPR